MIRPARSRASGSAHPSPIWPVLLLVIGLAASSCQVPQGGSEPVARPVTTTITTVATTAAPTPSVDKEVTVEVSSVTDGDTIRVIMPDGTNEPVRLIGIDAPEDGSLLAQEATGYMEELVLGERVRLVIDMSERDRFDRLLRYVYVGDLFVNEEMVRAGLAIARRYEPDTAMALVLEAAQGGAESAALGLFSPGATTTVATTAPADCSPYYPDFCIPPPPPDLDCGDIGAKDITVLLPDPHGFDGDGDGVGCES